MKRICPRCNELLLDNCYVKDKGINTLSYLELIIKKDQFSKEPKEIKSCYCPICGYVELYIDLDNSQHTSKYQDDDIHKLRQTVRNYAEAYHNQLQKQQELEDDLIISINKKKIENEYLHKLKKEKRTKKLRKYKTHKRILRK